MSEQLIHVFMANTPVHLDEAQAEGEKQLTWKVVLRTGTWKLRPGPGGVKLNAPLKIFRDKAPKGHISLTALKTNFEAGAKEHVTVPQVHADGTTSDGGFVEKLVIQDVKDKDGKVKESLLWAGMDITDSDLKKKIDETSMRGVSGGILFDYQRTEDAKKFDQVLSHVMATNSPWINGTGGFHKQLPAEVMASEPEDLPIGEVEFESSETDPQPQLPVVQLDDPKIPEPPEPGAASSKVIWKPEQGLRYVQDRIQKALREWRQAVMASLPREQRYEVDWPYYHASDVSLDGESTGAALITSGYGSEADSWVAAFKFNDDREVEIDPFTKWTPAKQEWVAASEDPPKPSAPPAGRGSTIPQPPPRGQMSMSDLGLREAQEARAERMQLGNSPSTTGGRMPRLSEIFSGVELSDEQRETLRAEDARIARLEADEQARQESAKLSEVAKYCGTPDGQTKGVLDELGLGDPGVKKYVRNALLSDDGGAAIELSEVTETGQKTAGVPRTATELLKGFIDSIPKDKDGRVSLSEQARRLPDDPPPPVEPDKKDEVKDPSAGADALLAEFDTMGLGGDLAITKGA